MSNIFWIDSSSKSKKWFFNIYFCWTLFMCVFLTTAYCSTILNFTLVVQTDEGQRPQGGQSSRTLLREILIFQGWKIIPLTLSREILLFHVWKIIPFWHFQHAENRIFLTLSHYCESRAQKHINIIIWNAIEKWLYLDDEPEWLPAPTSLWNSGPSAGLPGKKNGCLKLGCMSSGPVILCGA